MHTHLSRFLELGLESRSKSRSSGIPGSHQEDLKSSQCGFDPHSGHNFVRKSSHSSALIASVWIYNAYINAYTFQGGFSAGYEFVLTSPRLIATIKGLRWGLSFNSCCLCHWKNLEHPLSLTPGLLKQPPIHIYILTPKFSVIKVTPLGRVLCCQYP